ncbi:hypothetical protein CEP53_002954 [Fusarium sp. AF-6]|nr:hypothetical protein CEP53_002954 [Fusarium sp. AF-6]
MTPPLTVHVPPVGKEFVLDKPKHDASTLSSEKAIQSWNWQGTASISRERGEVVDAKKPLSQLSALAAMIVTEAFW